MKPCPHKLSIPIPIDKDGNDLTSFEGVALYAIAFREKIIPCQLTGKDHDRHVNIQYEKAWP